MALQVGSYIGTGTYDRTISLPFTPECVIVYSATAAPTILTSSLAPLSTGGVSVGLVDGAQQLTPPGTTGIAALVGNGFRVQDDPSTPQPLIVMDRAGIRYHYLAVNTEGGYFAHGAFSTDPPVAPFGVDIDVSIGFAPVWAYAAPGGGGGDGGGIRGPSWPPNPGPLIHFCRSWALGNVINMMEATATGLTLSYAHDAAVNRYIFWIAFREAAGIVAMLTYAGDGTDNRIITGAGFAPDFAFCTTNRDTNGLGSANENVWRFVDMPSGESYKPDSHLSLNNRFLDGITSLDSDGVTVGTNARVNGSGVNTHISQWSTPPYDVISFDILCLRGTTHPPVGGGARAWAAIL